MKCRNCGTENQPSSLFCQKCGKTLDDQVESKVEDKETEKNLRVTPAKNNKKIVIIVLAVVLSLIFLVLAIMTYSFYQKRSRINESLQKQEYLTKVPSFSLNSGSYQGDQILEINKSDQENRIFYTTDGSEPSLGSLEYKEPIALTKGDHTIKAIEVNPSGVAGKVVEGLYSIVEVEPVQVEPTVVEPQANTEEDYRNFSLYASSNLPPMAGISYQVGNLMDRNDNTAWVEGVAGDGIGETIQCVYNGSKPLVLHGFLIKAGYIKTSKAFEENGSPRQMTVSVNNNPISSLVFIRSRGQQEFTIDPVEIYPGDSISFVLDSVFLGPQDGEHDTAITEIRFY